MCLSNVQHMIDKAKMMDILSLQFRILCLFVFCFSISNSNDVPNTYAYLGEDANFSWILSEPLPVYGEAFTVLNPKRRVLFITSGNKMLTEPTTNQVIFKSYDQSGHLSFIIEDVEQSDEGIYYVRYRNKPRQGQRLVVLTSIKQPEIKEIPYTGINDIALDCTTISLDEISENEIQYSFIWFWNDENLHDNVQYQTVGSRIYVTNVTEEDDGSNITCIVTVNERVKSVMSNAYIVQAKYGPKEVFLSKGSGIYNINSSVLPINVSCSAKCYPPCDYNWHKNDNKEIFTKGATLSFPNISTSQYRGRYYCVAKNTAGRAISEVIQFNPSRSSKFPKVHLSFTTKWLIIGGSSGFAVAITGLVTMLAVRRKKANARKEFAIQRLKEIAMRLKEADVITDEREKSIGSESPYHSIDEVPDQPDFFERHCDESDEAISQVTYQSGDASLRPSSYSSETISDHGYENENSASGESYEALRLSTTGMYNDKTQTACE